jgi:hypothetical protein
MKNQGVLFVLFFLFSSSLLKAEFDPADANLGQIIAKIRKLNSRIKQASSEKEKEVIHNQYLAVKAILSIKQRGEKPHEEYIKDYSDTREARKSLKGAHTPSIRKDPFFEALKNGVSWTKLSKLAETETSLCKSYWQKYSSVDELQELYARKNDSIVLVCALYRHLEYLKKNPLGQRFVPKQQRDLDTLQKQIERINAKIFREKEKLMKQEGISLPSINE